jgi:hypothetical protein
VENAKESVALNKQLCGQFGVLLILCCRLSIAYSC